MAETAYIGIGSNLGDCLSYLRSGVAGLAGIDGVQVRQTSSIYVSAPIGSVPQPDFLNAVFAVETTLSPADLLSVMRSVEDRHGRERSIHWGPRTLDLDLLLQEDRQIDQPHLQLPHPHMLDRCFVLKPLCEIAGGLLHPTTHKPLESHLSALDCHCGLRQVEARLLAAP